MTRDEVQRWLDRYCEAWRTYDAQAIGDLFSADADYRYHPWDEPVHGRDEIVRAWTAPSGDESSRDAPDSWGAEYRPLAIDGDLAVTVGRTVYFKPDRSVDQTYENLWVLRFDADGRCSDFTEWFMVPKTPVAAES